MARKTIDFEKKKDNVSVAAENVAAAEIITEPVKKSYKQDDLITCSSLVSGGYYLTGPKSKFPYTFADYGDEIGIEYQDLLYLIRSHDKAVFEPRMVIEDNEIVSKYPEIEKIYEALYSVNDLRDIVNCSPSQIEKIVTKLPKGAVETLKGLVSTMIENHTLDSVSKIKALDKILGTNLLLGLVQD